MIKTSETYTTTYLTNNEEYSSIDSRWFLMKTDRIRREYALRKIKGKYNVKIKNFLCNLNNFTQD